MKGNGIMELTNPSVIKEVLSKNGFSFKKSLGQNFLINPTVCPKMAENAVLDGETNILEIGPGIGVLTAELCKVAKRVVSIELDERLRPVLAETMDEYDNLEVIFGDAMKLDLGNIIKEKFPDGKIAVCANLPYYITSPIIMNLLESRLPFSSITVMVQKEAAERICAKVGSRESGAVTVAVRYYSEPQVLFNVSRGSFMPAPNVDSAVIRLKVLENRAVNVKNEKMFFKMVRSAFEQRRKTFQNSAAKGLGVQKETVKEALLANGLYENIRAEKMTMDDLAAVCNYVNDIKA